MVLSLYHTCSRGSYITVNSNKKGMHLPHGLTWLCELSFFFSHSVHFCQIRKLSYLHNFITNLSTYFSVVILEKQPIPSKIWFWEASRPANPTFGPSGVWLHDYIFQLLFSLGDENKKLNDKENCYLSLKNNYQGLGKWAVFTFDCASQCDRKWRRVSQIPIIQTSLFFI